jgi:hypothetical protein
MTQPYDPDPREAKLPVWAQDIINSLRRLAAEADRLAETARLNTDPDTSTAVVDVPIYGHGSDVGRTVGLGVRPNIGFRAGTGPHGNKVIHARQDEDGVLEVYTSGGGLAVVPWSGNAIRIRVTDR